MYTNLDECNATLTYEDFKSLIKDFHFSPREDRDVKLLYFQYKQFVQFGISTVVNLRANENINDLCINVIKQYVLIFQYDQCCQFIRFISFVVCFPVSEAIVESWGSSLENIYNKHCVKDGSNLYNVGTVDHLTLIRLNGPPLSMTRNKCLYNDALNMMFSGDYACHFTEASNWVPVLKW